MRRLWTGIVLLTCIGMLLTVAGPHLYAILARHKAVRSSAAKTRAAVYRWQTLWGNALWRIFTGGMRMTVHIDDRTRSGGRPAIVVGNHTSTMDLFLMTQALTHAGHVRLLAVMKRQISRIPFVGRGARVTGCAELRRDGGDADLIAIRKAARRAADDAATVFIFPEGTRSEGDDPSWKNVRRPRPRGFSILVEELPERPVIAVTFDWHGVRARTLLDLVGLFGRRIDVRMCDVPMTAADPGDDLVAAWKVMDASLGT